MTSPLIARAEQHDYQKLFLLDLNWSRPDQPPITHLHDGRSITATNVSSYKGLRVWVVNEKPNAALEAAIDQRLAATNTDRILIFHDDAEQVWRWPVRRTTGNTTTTRLSRHKHRTGDPDPRFAAKLESITLPTDKTLDSNTVLAKVRQAFDVEAQNETRFASKLMARLYTTLEKAYPGTTPARQRDHEISVTLARIIFLMFGDDTDMWPENTFQDFIVDHTKPDGSDIGANLSELFAYLDTAPEQRSHTDPKFDGFRYVNGGIFHEHITLPTINAEFRTAVLGACDRDWTTISPAIFGSMFQSVRDAQTRRELGEHYTSEENILKTLNPLFLDELRSDYAAAIARETEQKQINSLNALWKRLGDLRYLDPACGCGNFIIVAYRELRDIELTVMEALLDRQKGSDQLTLGGDLVRGLRVTLDHFYGIEIDEWPARIASTAMFLVDRQCDLRLRERFGEAPERLPLRTEAKIVVGNALQVDWSDIVTPSSAVVIAGNPPFLGISLRSPSQTAELQQVWGSGYHGTLDYVTGWHAKTLDYFRDVPGRWAFVTTSSITQGEVVAPLFTAVMDAGWRIGFAHRTFRWTSEAAGGAAVHCVIIGFTRDTSKARLFDYPTPASRPVELPPSNNISPYLTVGDSVIVHPSTKPLNPQLGQVAYGNKPTDGGHLIIGPDKYAEVMTDQVAAKYVRPYVGARELLHGGQRHCLWLTGMTDADLHASPVLQEAVEGVREERASSKAASTRDAARTPHLFRQISQPASSYLCIPAHVSEERRFFLTARFGSDVVASNANFIAPDEDGFMFAIISSTMFMTWQRTVGGRLESRLRFNKLLTWNTFPLPHTDATARQHIIAAGAAIIQAREATPGLSLADMYDPASTADDLLAAHEALDTHVGALFNLRPGTSTLIRQEALFAHYERLTAPLVAAAQQSKRGQRRGGTR